MATFPSALIYTSYAGGVMDGANNFQISGFGGTSYLMGGRADEVGIWKKVLTAQERTDLYNSRNGLPYN